MAPPINLSPQTTVRDVADAARFALDAFLALDPNETRELQRWFVGPYHEAIRFVPTRGTGHPGPSAQSPVSELVANAQATVAQAILAASKPGAEGLVALLPPVVDVVGVRDVFGAHGFAPTRASHARLTGRVLSLLVADYLTRPDEYVAPASQRPTLPTLRAAV